MSNAVESQVVFKAHDGDLVQKLDGELEDHEGDHNLRQERPEIFPSLFDVEEETVVEDKQ